MACLEFSITSADSAVSIAHSYVASPCQILPIHRHHLQPGAISQEHKNKAVEELQIALVTANATTLHEVQRNLFQSATTKHNKIVYSLAFRNKGGMQQCALMSLHLLLQSLLHLSLLWHIDNGHESASQKVPQSLEFCFTVVFWSQPPKSCVAAGVLVFGICCLLEGSKVQVRRKMTSNVLDATGFASPASEESKGCFLGFRAKLRPLSLSQLMSCQEKIKKQ